MNNSVHEIVESGEWADNLAKSMANAVIAVFKYLLYAFLIDWALGHWGYSWPFFKIYSTLIAIGVMRKVLLKGVFVK